MENKNLNVVEAEAKVVNEEVKKTGFMNKLFNKGAKVATDVVAEPKLKKKWVKGAAIATGVAAVAGIVGLVVKSCMDKGDDQYADIDMNRDVNSVEEQTEE